MAALLGVAPIMMSSGLIAASLDAFLDLAVPEHVPGLHEPLYPDLWRREAPVGRYFSFPSQGTHPSSQSLFAPRIHVK